MHFLVLLVVLLSNLILTAGRPDFQDGNDFDPSNNTLTCIFLTTEPNWSGEMENLCQVSGVCAAQLPDGLTANVTSAGPTDGQTCFLYSGPGCSGNRSNPIVYPGYADLSTIGFDKTAVSWACWKMCGYIVETSSSASVSTVEPTIPVVGTSASAVYSSSSAAITFTNSSVLTGRALALDATNNAPSITTTLGMGSSTATPSVRLSTTTSFAPSITTTLRPSSSTELPSVKLAITTTLSGFIPAVDPSSITQTQSQSQSQTSTSTSTSLASSSISANLTTFSLVSIPASTTSVNMNTPGFSMSPSPVTLTHTFADGSTTVVTTSVIEPVPTLPTVPLV